MPAKVKSKESKSGGAALFKALSSLYSAKMNARFKGFIENEEYRECNHKPGPDVDRWYDRMGEYLVCFDDMKKLREINEMYEGGGLVEESPTFVPLTPMINEEEGAPYFLIADMADGKCPVYHWDEGDARLWFHSLDAFLKAIKSGKEVRAAEEVKSKEKLSELHKGWRENKAVNIDPESPTSGMRRFILQLKAKGNTVSNLWLVKTTKRSIIQAFIEKYDRLDGKTKTFEKSFPSEKACLDEVHALVKRVQRQGYAELRIGLPKVHLDRLKQVQDAQDRRMEELDIFGADPLLGEVYKCLSLKKLVLRNEIKALGPGLGMLKNLEQLEVENISGPIAREIGELANLKVLRISSHKENLILPEEISRLKSLERLTVSGIKKLPKGIGKLDELKELYISNSGITELPKGLFKLRKLRELHVFGCKIKAIPAEIGKLDNLESLSVTEGGLTSLPKGVYKLKKLGYLDLQENGLKNISKDLFARRNIEIFY